MAAKINGAKIKINNTSKICVIISFIFSFIIPPFITELNNNLTFPDGTKFYPDIKDGVRGCNTDAARGADTFIPFNGKPTITKIYTTKNAECNGSIDVTDISKNYKVLTVENFFIEPISGYTIGGGYWSGKKTNWTPEKDKSYDSNTGIFTFNGLYTAQTTSSAGGLICDIFLVE